MLDMTEQRPAGRPRPEYVHERIMDDPRRKALMEFMRKAGHTNTSWCRAAGLRNGNVLTNYYRGHTNELSPQTLDRLRKAIPGATLAEMLGERPRFPAAARLMRVTLEARANGWIEALGLPAEDQFEVAMPAGIEIPLADEVVRVADSHADAAFARGTLLYVRHLSGLDRALRPGDTVLVQRTRRGLAELTVRQVHAGAPDGPLLLGLRSARQHEAAGRVPMPQPYDGGSWEYDGDRWQVRGLAVFQQGVLSTD